jgi:hypothetical protein
MGGSIFLVMPSLQSDPDFQKKLGLWKVIARESGWEISFPKYDLGNPVFDLSSTLAEMDRCTLVVADLSFERPSCYFELGLAEALQKKVAVIARSGTPIHQTSYRCAVRTFKSLDDFFTLIKAILSDNASA